MAKVKIVNPEAPMRLGAKRPERVLFQVKATRAQKEFVRRLGNGSYARGFDVAVAAAAQAAGASAS